MENAIMEIKKTYEKDTIILAKKSFKKNGIQTFFIPIFPKTILKQEIIKNGGKQANIAYKYYLKNVGSFWILNGLQLVIAIISSQVIGSNRLLLGISVSTTLVLIISSIFALRKLKHYLANSIWHHNENVLFNNAS